MWPELHVTWWLNKAGFPLFPPAFLTRAWVQYYFTTLLTRRLCRIITDLDHLASYSYLRTASFRLRLVAKQV